MLNDDRKDDWKTSENWFPLIQIYSGYTNLKSHSLFFRFYPEQK